MCLAESRSIPGNAARIIPGPLQVERSAAQWREELGERAVRACGIVCCRRDDDDSFPAVAADPLGLAVESRLNEFAQASLCIDERPRTTGLVARRHDAEGARANRIGAIGVGWGYGSRSELEAAGVLAICKTPAELPSAIDSVFASTCRDRRSSST